MYGYIYKIIFPLNSFKLQGYPFYIGQKKSSTIDDNYYGSGRKVRDWFKSHGLNSRNCNKEDVERLHIKKEIIYIVSDEEGQELLNNYEFQEIQKYQNDSLCLNLRDGGNQGILSEETKQIISDKTKEAMANPIIYNKYKKAHTTYYTENKEKVSEIAKKRIEKTKNYEIMNLKNKDKNIKIWSDSNLHEKRRIKMNKSNPNVKPILCVETNIIYDSIRNAEKILHIYHIKRALQNPRKTVGGFHWIYAD